MTTTTNAYDELEQDEISEAFNVQRLINAKSWSMQGSYGRTMMDFIDSGYCLLGQTDTRDYYGNHIPSRDQVKAGTKGSYEYVAERHGTEWADRIAAVGDEALTLDDVMEFEEG